MKGQGFIILKIEGEKVHTKAKLDILNQSQMALLIVNLENIKNKLQTKFEKGLQTIEDGN